MHTPLPDDDEPSLRDLPAVPDGLPLAALGPAWSRLSLARADLSGLDQLPALETLQLSTPVSSPAALAPLRAHPALRHLALALPAAPDDALTALLATLPRLEALHVHAPAGADAATLARVAALPRLRSLRLDGAGATPDVALASLAAAPHLRALRTSALAALTGVGVASLAALPALEVLALDKPARATADALAALRELPRLAALSLAEVRGLRDEDHAPLAGLTGLRGLSLYHSPAGGKVAASVAALTGLRWLHLGWSNIEGKALASLASLTALEALDLSHAKVPGPTLAAVLRAMPLRTFRTSSVTVGPWAQAFLHQGTLESLALGGVTITNARLAALAGLPRLRTLELWNAKGCTAAGVRALGRAATLEALDLGFLALDLAAFEALASLPRLRTLELAYARGVTEAGLRALARCGTLERLNVHGLPAASAAVLEALVAATPLRSITAWRCAEVRPPAMARMQAAWPTLVFDVEDWQRDPVALPRRARASDREGQSWLAPGARRVLTHNWQRTTLVDLDDGTCRELPAAATMYADVFRACGRLVGTGGRDHLTVHPLDGGAPVVQVSAPGTLRGACASRDGALVVAVGEGFAECWDAAADAPRWRVELPWEAAGASVSDDGSRVVVWGAGVAVLRADAGELALRVDTPAWCARLWDGALHVVTAARALERWSLADGAVEASWSPPREGRLRLTLGPDVLARRRAAVSAFEEPAHAVTMARRPGGAVRVLLDCNGRDGELWADGAAVHLHTDGTIWRPDLSDDGALLLLPVHFDPKGSDLYDVDAVLALARTPLP